MSFATDLFSGLAGFRDHLAEIASPLVGVVEADLAKLGPLVAQDVRQAEQVAKDILHNLYGRVPGQLAEPAAPVTQAAPAEPVLVSDGGMAGPSGLDIQHVPAEPVHAEAVAAPVAEPAPVVAEAEPPTTASA